MSKVTKEWLVSLPGVSYHETEPGRGYFLYRNNPDRPGGFSSPDMEDFIEDLKDLTPLKQYF